MIQDIRQPRSKSALALSIEGMKCGRCVSWVHDVLKRLPGVEVNSVQVGSARLAHDASQVSEDAIIGALWEVGYKARKESAV